MVCDSQTLEAFLFEEWTIAGVAETNASNPLLIYMDGDKNVTPTFSLKQELNLTVTNGASSIPEGLTSYSVGSDVVVEVTPLIGYGDVQWGGTAYNSGDDSINGNTCTLTMNNEYTLTATCSKLITGIIYVSPDGNNSDGSSWQTAFNDFQDALDIAVFGNQIWVAAGTYYSDKDSITSDGTDHTDDDRSESFILKDGVDIYGGFVGYETSINQRKPGSNLTILSGDITQDDVDGMPGGDNSFHVVTAVAGSFLDGFTIRGGLADDVNGVEIHGAGIFCQSGEMIIRNCHVTGNQASQDGAGIYIDSTVTDMELTNCILDGNFTFGYGGGIFCASDSSVSTDQTSFTMTNCTIHANKAIVSGGGLYTELEIADSDTLTSINCIYWTNIDSSNNQNESAQIYNADTVTPGITYSCIMGLTQYASGTGNISQDPTFIQNGEWKWHLQDGTEIQDGANPTTIDVDPQDIIIYDFHQQFAHMEKGSSHQEDNFIADLLDDGTHSPLGQGNAGKPYLRENMDPADKATITGDEDKFYMWFNDDAINNGPINTNIQVPWSCIDSANGIFQLNSDHFFPIDGLGYGGELDCDGHNHNWFFTLQYHTQSTYIPGQVLTFRASDDLFIAINGVILINRAGYYDPTHETTLTFDNFGNVTVNFILPWKDPRTFGVAEGLILDPYKTYDFSLFYANRHTCLSSLVVERTPGQGEMVYKYIPGDYHIQASCIDAGNNEVIPAGVIIDFDGIERWIDDPDTDDTGSGTAPFVDMGAYEYIAEDYYFDVYAGEDKEASISGSSVMVSLWDAELTSPYANDTDYPDTTFTWTVERGPAVGTITFLDTATGTSSFQNPEVILDLSGFESVFDIVDSLDFILEFTANDSVQEGLDLVKITVYKNGFTQRKPQVILDGPYVVKMADLPLTITGTISDDGEPLGALTAGWDLANASGIGGADFSPVSHLATDEHYDSDGKIFMDISSEVTFTQPGRYQVKLTAVDGDLYDEAFTTVEVVLDNNPPVVEAGTYDSIVPDTYPYVFDLKNNAKVTLSPSVVDDWLLKQVEVSWKVISAPINGMIYNPKEPLSKLTFTKTGVYILQLEANDGQYTITDQATIILDEVPQVEAGENKNGVLAGSGVTINMSDAWAKDNHFSNPGDPEDLTLVWKVIQPLGSDNVVFEAKVSDTPTQAGEVTFASKDDVVRDLTFLESGAYQLQLSAVDGDASLSSNTIVDTVWITISKPVILGTALFAGGSQKSPGGNGALVYRKYPGGDWDVISPELGDAVLCLCAYENELYAGTMVSSGEAQVRKWNGASGWSSESVYGGGEWGDKTVTRVYALVEYNGSLFAGTDASDVLFRYDGTQWEPIPVLGHSSGIRSLYVWDNRLYLDANKSDGIDYYDSLGYHPQAP